MNKKILISTILLTFLIIISCLFVLLSNLQYYPQNFFITSWNKQALDNHPPFLYLQEKLSKSKNGNYHFSYLEYNEKLVLKPNELYLANRFWVQTPQQKYKDQSYLWQVESPNKIDINPKRWIHFYKKVFTWHKQETDGKDIIFLPIPYDYPPVIKTTDLSQKNILLTQVAANHYSRSKFSLYPLREKIVIWFLENHPNDFVFYGKKWERTKQKIAPQYQKYFNSQYKGYAPEKKEVISKAKFALAIENTNFSHYVTEKIFDVMVAGTVPIYFGAPNITEYVPKECFIDLSDFINFEHLYSFLVSMDDETYFKYIHCIDQFFKDPTKHPNHPKNVAQLLFKHLDLKPTKIDWPETMNNMKNFFKFQKN